MALDYKYVLPGGGYAENNIVKEMFDDIKLYLDAFVPSGGAAPIGAQYVTLATNATLTSERVLTAGTAITLTDNGAGSTVVVANTGVTSLIAGSGISISGGTGAITITNTNPTPGANTALSNLAAVAINVALLPGTTNSIDLGSLGKTWHDLHISRDIALYEGTTGNVILIQAPTSLASYTFKFPDSGGIVNYVLRTDGAGTTSWVPQTSLSSAATIELDNLGVTAVNTHIKPGSDNSIDLGSGSKNWRNVYTKSGVYYQDSGDTNSVLITASSTMAASWTLTLPISTGTNGYVLTTNGSGVTSWVDPGTFPSGANTALSNLASVAINASLIVDGVHDQTYDLGSTTLAWRDVYAVNLRAGRSGVAGIIYIYPATSAKGHVIFTKSDNATDSETTINVAAQSTTRLYTIGDMGADATFLMTAGAQTITGAKTFASSALLLQEASSTDVITIAIASLAAGRTYTMPDAGASASFVMTEGTQTINGAKTFGSVILLPDGAVGGPSWSFSADTNNGAYRIGTDNWAMSAAGAKIWETSAAGAINHPLQPSFLATISGTQTDCTGDGTAFAVPFGTEIFDQGSNFASNTFTAPVTGRYMLTVAVRPENILVGHTTRRVSIVTSNRAYSVVHNYALAQTNLTLTISVIADMDVNDTATIELVVDGSTKTVDLSNSPTVNFFSGSLIN